MKELQSLEETQSYDVQEEQIGQRLDRFLAPLLPSLSRTNIQQLIADEAVLVKDKASKPGYALRRGDVITIVRSTLFSLQQMLQRMSFPSIFSMRMTIYLS